MFEVISKISGKRYTVFNVKNDEFLIYASNTFMYVSMHNFVIDENKYFGNGSLYRDRI